MIKNWAILEKFDSVYVDYLTSQVFDLSMVCVGFAKHDYKGRTFVIREKQFKTIIKTKIMRSRNKVFLNGNVGNDPEVHTFEDGSKAVQFSLATSEQWKDKNGEKKEATEWHKCVAYKGLAGIIEEYVKKGDKIDIEGKLKTRSYGEDDNKKYITEIIVRDVILLGGRSNESTGIGDNVKTKTSSSVTAPQPDDDLPF